MIVPEGEVPQLHGIIVPNKDRTRKKKKKDYGNK